MSNLSNLNVLNTLREMFVQRGYTDISETDNYIIGYDESKTKVIAIKNITKLNVEEIKNIFSMMEDENTKNFIIVHKGEPTSAVNNAVANTNNISYCIELFQDIDLQYNITKHYLVPKHEKATKEEIKEIKEKLSLKNLPKISKSDAIARFYNYRKGDIIRVTRRNGEICYRLVVN